MKKLLLISLCFPMMFVSCNFTDSNKDIAKEKDSDSVIYSDAKEYFSDIIELQMEILRKINGYDLFLKKGYTKDQAYDIIQDW